MYPSAIAVDGIRDRLYVANGGSDTVSVIDTQNNTRIGKDIPVGKNPSAIAVDEGTNTTYVANSGDDTVSIIDSEANKVVAKVMFNIEASNSGNIQCDNTNGSAPLRQQFYVYSGCTARPNPGFDFVSWQENLGRNSTQLINATTEPSTLDTIPDFFHMQQNRPTSKLNIAKFGNFTAIFKPLPPPMPPEYTLLIITVIVTSIIGWSWNSIIGFAKAKMQRKHMKECIEEIGKLDKNTIEEKITGYYVEGKLNEDHRQLLKDKISDYYGRDKSSERYGAPFT